MPSPLLAGSMQGGLAGSLHSPYKECFPLPVRPPACCSGCPHRAEVSLWLPLELPATKSPAPDAACCLPSPVTVLRFTPMGRQIMAKLIVRRNFIKKKPFKAAAYWYSVVKFPTFRRKAYNKHTESCAIFLGIKIPICTNPGYVCSYFVFSYNMRSKTGKKRTLPLSGQRLFIVQRLLLYFKKLKIFCSLLNVTAGYALFIPDTAYAA